MTTRLLITTAALSLIAISAASAAPRHHGHHVHHYGYASAGHRYVIPGYYVAPGYQRYAAERAVAAGNWSCTMGPDLQCYTIDGGTIWTSPEGNQRLP